MNWFALGPFPLVADTKTPHASLEHDYLIERGGEAAVRIDGSLTVEAAGTVLRGRPVQARNHVVDLAATFHSTTTTTDDLSDTNNRVAYAYTELDQAQASTALAVFGSDDGALVWVNGELVHRAPVDRVVDPDADRFDMKLQAGRNRILVKVDNGAGGWGFALRILDQEGRRRFHSLDARKHLDQLAPGPPSNEFLLGPVLPEIVWRDAPLALTVFGAATTLSVRWFGPDLTPVKRPEAYGRYAAVLEARTRDGYRYRRMLSFAKVPAKTAPWFRTAPFSDELPLLPFSSEVNATPAQRMELTRQIWRGGLEALWHGENSAVAASALFELKNNPPASADPAWLASGFITNATYQLALRMKLEGRTPRPLAPPVVLSPPVGRLRPGGEAPAKMKPGTTTKLRSLARAWAKSDPNGFVVLVARHGVVFLHEGFNGFTKDSLFYPASVSKPLGGLLFARAVNEGLLTFDTPLSQVFPDWAGQKTRRITFRHCFNHLVGFHGHRSHGGMFNAYLDSALLTEDAAFAEPGRHFSYNSDDFNLAGKALELTTGTPIWRLLYEQLEKPFGEPVMQTDMGAGASFNAMYLAKVGQMLLQDGAYGDRRFLRPGFVRQLLPRRIGEFAPELDDQQREAGIGFEWTTDPVGPREKGVLGPNVIGHGAASGVIWRVALDHDLVVVLGRSAFKDAGEHTRWTTEFLTAVAAGLGD